MKKPFTLTMLIAASFATLALVACGKSASNNNPAPAPAPVDPGLVIPSGVKIGFFAQNSKMDMIFPGSAGTTSYNFQSPGMNNILKYAMRTCDRATYNGGLVTCASYLSGPNDIMIFANGSQASSVQMVLRSMPDTSCQSPYYCSNYWYSLPSFSQFILGLFGFNTFNNSNIYNPMILNMTIWPINNSRGFELRGYAPGGDELRGYAPGGDLAYGSSNLLFQFQVAVGKLEDAGWDYRLVFNGEVAAQGHMVRCQNATCGLQ